VALIMVSGVLSQPDKMAEDNCPVTGDISVML
jgi:hypothetical protein